MSQTPSKSRLQAPALWQRSLFQVSTTLIALTGMSACVVDQVTSLKPKGDTMPGVVASSGGNSAGDVGTDVSGSAAEGKKGGGKKNKGGNSKGKDPKGDKPGEEPDGEDDQETDPAEGSTTSTGADKGSQPDDNPSVDIETTDEDTGKVKPGLGWVGDDFEDGTGAWKMAQGVWEFGSPTALDGPKPLSGKAVAGTVLNGNYPGINARREYRLISPRFTIPKDGETPRIRYHQWFDFGSSDEGRTLVKIDGVSGGAKEKSGGIWKHTVAGDCENIWGQSVVYFDPKHAGKKARIIFELISVDGRTGPGWFIDDISVEASAPKLDNGDFENGWDEWSVEGSIWNIGEPIDTRVPRPRSGKNVAGTVLGGNYPSNFSKNGGFARLATPRFRVPKNSKAPLFRFYEWYSLASSDEGSIQVSVQGSSSSWKKLSGSTIKGVSGKGWRERVINLRAYRGRIIQIGFLMRTLDGRTSSGWFLDDVEFVLD